MSMHVNVFMLETQDCSEAVEERERGRWPDRVHCLACWNVGSAGSLADPTGYIRFVFAQVSVVVER